MKKPKKAWKPIPVAVQVKRHHKAVVTARKAAAHHPSAAVTAKRSVAAKKAAATRAKHRKWTPDGDVALCSARAVAESLRLALGVRVSHGDVLALYWLVADDADAGASILATLDAASEYGLVGFNPAWMRPVPATAPVVARVAQRAGVPPHLERSGVDRAMPVIDGAEENPVVTAAACEHALNRNAGLAGVPAGALLGDYLPHQEFLPVGPDLPWSDLNGRGPCAPALAPGRSITAHERQPGRTRCGLFGYASKPGGSSIILGLDLPLGDSHAVAVGPDGTWWSWGEPYSPDDFPGAVIEEAWAVTWA